MKFLRRVYFVLLYALPAVLFFSYYPVISLGANASMNFELSLPLLWLVMFNITAFILLITFRVKSLVFLRTSAGHDRGRDARHPRRRDDATAFLKDTSDFPVKTISDRKFFLFSLFPLYATLSIFWSSNPTRAVLTAGIIWLLFFAVFAIVYITPLLNPAKNFRRTLLKTFFISSAIICIVCWLQTILDAFGVGRETTLLCPGCISQTFGFPHPSGFAIEPQFMGNLLLAPTLTALYFLTREKKKYHLMSFAFLFSATLFFTFSRGAIYAFSVALIILLIFALIRHQFRPALIIIPVIAFIFTLTMQGAFNVIGPIHGSFCSGITKSLNQLSLGIIDLRSACPVTPAQTSMINQMVSEQPISIENATEIVTHTQSAFDGYIAESTDIRLGLNSVALQTWSATPSTVIFGVGLGSAGTAMHRAFPEIITTPKEIVQNQPLSLLLELGLVGIILIIFSLLLAFCPHIFPAKFVDGRNATTKPISTFWHHPALPPLLSLIVAYLVTLQFFSGLPNALQIYLLPPLLYFALQGDEKPIALSK